MSALKKSTKSKFVPESINDYINSSNFLKDSPKTKKNQKRQKNETDEDENIFVLGELQATSKKKKLETNIEASKESRQKLIDAMNNQLRARKQGNNRLLKKLADVLVDLESDCNILNENEQKLEHLTGALLKCIQQSTNAHKQKLKTLKDIHACFQKECEDLDNGHKAETDKLANDLEQDIKNLQQKLVAETKRSGWETLRKTIFQAMQEDF